MFRHVALLVVVSLALTVVVGFVLWLLLAKPDLATTTPPATGPRPLTAAERLDSLKLALAVVAGIGGIVALTVAYRKQRQGEAAERREETKLFTERFVKSSEQLGHDSPRVRVAGAYAMAELADDWASGRQMCVDVLCAYIRLPYETDDESERQVRWTLFRIIRNHLRPDPKWGRVKWSDCRFSFEGAVIDGADLSKVQLDAQGNMSFFGVRFIGWFDFAEARLGGAPVWFNRARFESGDVSFQGADFRGSQVVFEAVEFAGGMVTFEGLEADPDSVILDGAAHTGGEVVWGPLAALPRPVPARRRFRIGRRAGR
ncbi:hypothetical protein CLV67_118114 [Actinoplanes italicus]|uniref:Pentapeptide repeat protein n=2 Tax=Actinoplanes italicus TaxID=113567 RepID=A0A2T0K2I1_9ACTN|nr:hypothetical protein CLV67_118114 [Actinoplanes italicus]